MSGVFALGISETALPVWRAIFAKSACRFFDPSFDV